MFFIYILKNKLQIFFERNWFEIFWAILQLINFWDSIF